MTEKWKPVVGFEGAYEVSNHGRVRSLKRTVMRSNGSALHLSQRILRPATAQRTGHLHVHFSVNGRGFTRYVHRLVLEAFVGPCPEGMEACHGDGNPVNNHLGNLRWDTSSENNKDMVKHGNHLHARKTHCIRGHALEGPNLVPHANKRGSRGCLACSRARARIHYDPSLKPRLNEIADECYAAIVDSPKLEKTNG